MTDRILVVDDDRSVRLSLYELLRLEGYEVDAAEDGETALAKLRQAVSSQPFDLILLDLKMPAMDGMGVMEAARQIAPDTQIVMLTAHGSLESAIGALRHGAHDYLLKPAPTGDILASVRKGLERRRADVRRRGALESLEASLRELRGEPLTPQPSSKGREGVLTPLTPGPSPKGRGGGATLDPASHELRFGEKAISLTRNEVKLLACLMARPGEVVSHAQIVRELYGHPASGYEASEIVRPIVSRLRRKLAGLPGADTCLQTVKGVGYRFVGRAGGASNQ